MNNLLAMDERRRCGTGMAAFGSPERVGCGGGATLERGDQQPRVNDVKWRADQMVCSTRKVRKRSLELWISTVRLSVGGQ